MRKKDLLGIMTSISITLCFCNLQNVVWAQGMEAAGNSQLREVGVADSADTQDFYYSILDDGTVEIMGYVGSNTAPVIPATIEGRNVTRIGYQAFCDQDSLTKVSIPDSVTSIGEMAFGWCSSLEEINIPDSVTSIETHAFYECHSLREIKIPAGVTSIEEMTFDGCNNLTKVTIPDSVTNIGIQAFYRCRSLKEISIPKNVRSIGRTAFAGCYNLRKANLPNGITSIKNNTFWCCRSLSEISIPNSVTTIEYAAFCECSSLTKISIPNSVTTIGEEAFSNCNLLAEITIPASVTAIGDGAFGEYRENLTLYVQTGSYAESYARENGISHKPINVGNDSPDKTDTACKMTLSRTSCTYNGKNRKPTVTVKDSSGKKLKSGTDYSVTYPKSTKNVGRYTVKVTLRGKYSGTLKKTFKVIPKSTSITKLTAGKKKFTIKWAKQPKQVTGYEVMYSPSKKFPKNSTNTLKIKDSKTISRKATKLKAKRKYFVRIRTYKTVKINKKSTKFYSTWSKTKSVITK